MTEADVDGLFAAQARLRARVLEVAGQYVALYPFEDFDAVGEDATWELTEDGQEILVCWDRPCPRRCCSEPTGVRFPKRWLWDGRLPEEVAAQVTAREREEAERNAEHRRVLEATERAHYLRLREKYEPAGKAREGT